MNKYVTTNIGEIITTISIETDIPGYTIGIIECFLPEPLEFQAMSDKEIKEWIKTNNTRMKAICKFMNEQNL